MKNFFTAMTNRYKSRYVIPENHKKEYEDKNLKKLRWIMLALCVFGFVILVIDIINIEKLSTTRIKQVFTYYGSYFLFGGILSFLCFMFYRKELPVSIKRIPVCLSFVFIFAVTVYIASFEIDSSKLLSIYVILCVESLITIAFLHIDPIFFNVLILSVFLHLLLHQATEFSVKFNTVLLAFVICFLEHHKMFITVKDIKQTDKLSAQALTLKEQKNELEAQKKELLRLKDILEERVDYQENEIKEKNERLIQIQKHIIMSLSALVENRDKDTGLHVFRTSLYVKILAQEAKKRGLYSDIITDEYIDLLEKAAPMHDIGKIVVSDTILKKPGKLTDEEFKEMQKHALEGGRIILDVLGNSESPEYLRIATEITECHHEKWNGQGYPKGLSGEEIPLSARIMALADVFDALVSARCYKKEMTDDEAFGIIEEGIGKHFDPDLARLFISMRDEITEIKDRYKD